MTHSQARKNSQLGFTIVELLIVIVVIGILAAIAIVAFNGVQRRGIDVTLKSDLHNASTAMEIELVDSIEYPSTLPASVKLSPKVTLSLAGGSGSSIRYDTLTQTQNAVLFYDTCNDMVAQGWGLKEDQPSNPFITSCVVQEKTQLRINGWNAGKFVTTPVTAAKLATHVSSYTGGSVPLWQDKATIFMTKLQEQFTAQGGSFPIAAFWDPWATPTNGGVMKPSLPAPTVIPGASDGSSYCIEAKYDNKADTIMHLRKDGQPQAGPCA